MRDPLRQSLEKDGKQNKSGIRHSKAYHRFFEGYSEISVPIPNGKGTRIERIYTGNYYRQDLTKGRRILLRVLYVVNFLCMVYLFISSAILPLASNSTWYVVLPQAASVFFLSWNLIAFFSYLPARRDMTIADYRNSSLAFQKATLGCAISLGAAALVTLVFMLLNLSNEARAELLCAVRYVTGGFLALVMNRVEKKINY